MKAMVLREHGGMENLRLETDFPDPVIGEGDVLVRARAAQLGQAAVNRLAHQAALDPVDRIDQHAVAD